MKALLPMIGWEKVCWDGRMLQIPDGMLIDFGGFRRPVGGRIFVEPAPDGIREGEQERNQFFHNAVCRFCPDRSSRR